MPFCENCGNNVSTTAKFCPKCGNVININESAKPSNRPNISQPQNQLQVPRKKSGFVKYLILTGILVIAFFTNPTYRDHKNKILDDVLYPLIDKVGKEVGVDDLSSLSFLGVDVVHKGIKEYLDNTQDIAFKNYYLFSTIEYDQQTVSYGALGIVFIPPQVKNELNKQVKSIIDDTKSLLNNEKDVPYYQDDRNLNDKDNSSLNNNDEMPPVGSEN